MGVGTFRLACKVISFNMSSNRTQRHHMSVQKKRTGERGGSTKCLGNERDKGTKSLLRGGGGAGGGAFQSRQSRPSTHTTVLFRRSDSKPKFQISPVGLVTKTGSADGRSRLALRFRILWKFYENENESERIVLFTNLTLTKMIVIMVIFKRLSLKSLSALQDHEGGGGTG